MMDTSRNFIWPPDLDYHLVGDPGVTRDMALRAYRDVRAGRIDSSAATLSQALWPGCRLKAPAVQTGQSEGLRPSWAEDDDGGEEDDETRDVEYLIEGAYQDLISKRIPEAIAKLEEALYPEGVPAHVRAVERYAA